MLLALLAAALATVQQTHCLDSYLGLGMHQRRPAHEISGERMAIAHRDTIVRIDQIVAPPGKTVGFLYVTADGGRFFGTRTRAHQATRQARFVREIFTRDGLATPAQINSILSTQRGNAILYVPNEARLFPELGLQRQACVSSDSA